MRTPLILIKDFDLSLDEDGKVWCVERERSQIKATFRITHPDVLKPFRAALESVRKRHWSVFSTQVGS